MYIFPFCILKNDNIDNLTNTCVFVSYVTCILSCGFSAKANYWGIQIKLQRSFFKFFLFFLYINGCFREKQKTQEQKVSERETHTLAFQIYSKGNCESKTVNTLTKQFKKRLFISTLFQKLNKYLYRFTDGTECMQYISILPILH